MNLCFNISRTSRRRQHHEAPEGELGLHGALVTGAFLPTEDLRRKHHVNDSFSRAVKPAGVSDPAAALTVKAPQLCCSADELQHGRDTPAATFTRARARTAGCSQEQQPSAASPPDHPQRTAEE